MSVNSVEVESVVTTWISTSRNMPTVVIIDDTLHCSTRQIDACEFWYKFLLCFDLNTSLFHLNSIQRSQETMAVWLGAVLTQLLSLISRLAILKYFEQNRKYRELTWRSVELQ